MKLPQCKKYLKLNEASRNINYGTGGYCDNNLKGGRWYRFFKPAGTRMPDSPPSLQGKKCGTHATGWLQGGHPQKAGQVVSRRVCWSYTGEKCWRSYPGVQVKVTHCGSFFVYQLPSSPSCSYRYCAINKGT